MTLGPKLHIDHAALAHNLKRIKAFAPKQSILAMVKANGYGHGMWNVVSALDQIDALGVARLQDALQLRTRGVMQPIVVMGGFADLAELKACSTHQIDVVIHNPSQLEIFLSAHLMEPIRVWLKINTGMNRLGFSIEQAPDVYRVLHNHASVQKPIVLMTHFACADELENKMTAEQMERFFKVTRDWAGQRSLANSAGILGWPDALGDWVRPGIMMYGVSPFGDKVGADFGLKPVMTLSSTLLSIREQSPGDKIGYGSCYRCEVPMRVGTVAIGYGDGYPRAAPTGTPVWIRDARCPIVGRVSMDLLAVDLRNAPEAEVGDKVILWGPQLPAEIIANHVGTIAYELLCKMGHFHR